MKKLENKNMETIKGGSPKDCWNGAVVATLINPVFGYNLAWSCWVSSW